MLSASVASSLVSRDFSRLSGSLPGSAADLAGLRAGRDNVRAIAQQLVAAALVQPALASMREGSDAAAPFQPTAAEKRFGPMLDAMLAERIVGASNFELPRVIEQRLLDAANARKGPAA